MDFFTNKFFLLAITFGFYFLSKVIQKKTGWLVLNPILLAIALLICFLRCTDISYETYSEAGSLVEFWLKPAVVALGVPLYLQLKMIRKQLLPILISQLAGCIVGLVAVTIIAKLMGATPEVIMSLAPKSVTTPIAMEVSDSVDRTRLVDGDGFACCRYVACDGSKREIRRIRQFGTDFEWNPDCFACSYDFASVGALLRACRLNFPIK